jgi:hypothetical protein
MEAVSSMEVHDLLIWQKGDLVKGSVWARISRGCEPGFKVKTIIFEEKFFFIRLK